MEDFKKVYDLVLAVFTFFLGWFFLAALVKLVIFLVIKVLFEIDPFLLDGMLISTLSLGMTFGGFIKVINNKKQ